MKIAALVFSIIFIISAALQYNDPDPWLWIGIYGLAGVLSFLFYNGRRNLALYGIPMLVYFAGAIYLWPEEYKGVTMEMSYAPEIELARESLGLTICGLAFLLYLFLSYRTPEKERI